VFDVVEETDDDDDGRYMELFISVSGEQYTFKWIAPQTLLRIAQDLVAADERFDDPEPVVRAAFELSTLPEPEVG
jgi:hypothetical protein